MSSVLMLMKQNSLLYLPTQIRFPIEGEPVNCHGLKLTNSLARTELINPLNTKLSPKNTPLRRSAADFWDCLAPKSFVRHNVFRKENLGCCWLSPLFQMQNGHTSYSEKGLEPLSKLFLPPPFWNIAWLFFLYSCCTVQVDNSGRKSSTWERALAQRGTHNIELTCCFLDKMSTKPTTVENHFV